MDENPECPAVEAVDIPQVRELPPDGHEGLLQDILGEPWVAQDPPGDAEERVAGLVHQVRERLLVPRARPLDEVSVHLNPGLRRGCSTTVYP